MTINITSAIIVQFSISIATMTIILSTTATTKEITASVPYASVAAASPTNSISLVISIIILLLPF